MKDKKTISITFRTNKELKKSLQTLADKENRTLSSMIEILLENSVKVSVKKK